MPIIVTKISGTVSEAEYQGYLRLLCRMLMARDINLVSVPRVHEGDRWFYVWPTTEDAQEFSRRFNEQSEQVTWEVRETDAEVSHGPLRPLEVHVGRRPDGVAFALAPWARRTLQRLHPGSCDNTRIFITSEHSNGEGNGSLDRLVEQILPLLTGLSPGDMAEFDAFNATDPTTGEVLIEPIAIDSMGTVAR